MTIRFRDSVIVREVEGESVLLDLKRGYYFGLDRAGTRTWQLLRLNPRLRDVVSAMVDEYDVDEGTCARDLVAFVSTLRAYGLVEMIHRDGHDGACPSDLRCGDASGSEFRDGKAGACRDGHDGACPSDLRCGDASGSEGAAPAAPRRGWWASAREARRRRHAGGGARS